MPEERWRRPATVLEITPVSQGVWLPDGRVQGEVELTLAEETAERMRTGYMCAKCQEPFEVPWPERCHICGVAVRRDQAAFFAREFAGGRELGPSTTLADERERMLEDAERQQKEE